MLLENVFLIIDFSNASNCICFLGPSSGNQPTSVNDFEKSLDNEEESLVIPCFLYV